MSCTVSRGWGWCCCLLHGVNAGVFPAGIHQSQSSAVSDVVVGHVELLQWMLLQPLSQLQGPLVPQPSVHQGQVCQGLVFWQGLQQGAGSGVQQRVVTKSGEHIGHVTLLLVTLKTLNTDTDGDSREGGDTKKP